MKPQTDAEKIASNLAHRLGVKAVATVLVQEDRKLASISANRWEHSPHTSLRELSVAIKRELAYRDQIRQGVRKSIIESGILSRIPIGRKP